MKGKKMILSALIIVALVLSGVVFLLNRPSFGRLPRGERLERIKKSPNFRGGKFRNICETPQITSDKGLFGSFYDFLFKKPENLSPSFALPVQKTDLHQLNRAENVYVWFGHSSYLLQIDGKRFLIDPVLMAEIPMSLMFKPFCGTNVFSPDDMPEIDFLVITHDHWDHLDYSTVKQLKNKTKKVVCPLGVGEYLEYWGYEKENLVEMDWNEDVFFDENLAVLCLPSRHFSGRIPIRANRTLWASYMISVGGKNVYIGGDGGYDNRFSAIAERFGKIDLAIMENGQYNADWKYIHLMPNDLEQAVKDLQPARLITVHNSKFALARHAWDEPLKNAATMAQKNDFLLLMPKIGEIIRLDSDTFPTDEWWTER